MHLPAPSQAGDVAEWLGVGLTSVRAWVGSPALPGQKKDTVGVPLKCVLVL